MQININKLKFKKKGQIQKNKIKIKKIIYQMVLQLNHIVLILIDFRKAIHIFKYTKDY